jgi:hypothetical protein
MATNFEVRFLLVLWELREASIREGGEASIGKGKVNERFSGKRAEATAACANLVTVGAIEVSANGKTLTLTDAGETLLSESLAAGGGFEFSAQIGAKMANALLEWFRSNPVTSAEPVAKAEGSTIGSYEAFKVVALETFDRLNREYCYSGLVPIWHARQEVGSTVSRTEFNEWTMQMQAEQIFYLQTGEAIGATESQKQDSIENEIRGLLFYISQPN